MNLHPTLFLRWCILTQLLQKKVELMVNLDLTILLKSCTDSQEQVIYKFAYIHFLLMGAAITQDGGKFNHFKQKIF